MIYQGAWVCRKCGRLQSSGAMSACSSCGHDTTTFVRSLGEAISATELLIPMLLWCPECGDRHVDEGDFATKPHHTHACQSCGHVWRPAIVATCGVKFLPGFKNEVD